VEQTLPQEVELGSAVHAPFEDFNFVHMAFDGSIAPGQRDRLCWLVTSSALNSCGRSLGQNPWTLRLCAL